MLDIELLVLVDRFVLLPLLDYLLLEIPGVLVSVPLELLVE